MGALIAHVWRHKSNESAEDYLIPVSAGVVAGVSIIGVIVAMLNNMWLLK